MSDAAALMDRIYARQRHIYDASRKFYLLGRDGLIADLDAPPGSRILEIGCGTGRNLVKIARRYPEAACHGLDVSHTMLATARKAITGVGLESRISLAQADATRFDPVALFGAADFDRIVISYALSMIPAWREVLARAMTMIAPDGALYVVDFGNQAGLPAAFKRMLEAWLARFQVTPRLTLPSEIVAIARQQNLCASSRMVLRGYAVAARVTRPCQRSL